MMGIWEEGIEGIVGWEGELEGESVRPGRSSLSVPFEFRLAGTLRRSIVIVGEGMVLRGHSSGGGVMRPVLSTRIMGGEAGGDDGDDVCG